MAIDLTGVSVLVTRASHQAENLCRLIAVAGGEPVRFPVTEITSLPLADAAVAAALEQVPMVDIVIFVSSNAVQFALDLLELRGLSLPSGVQVLAVGSGTARQLTARGIAVSAVPARCYNSEGLLQLPQLQQVSGRAVLIASGQGGRAHLGDSLRARGAQVIQLPCYRRSPSRRVDNKVLARWQEGGIDLVVITSASTADHMLALLGEDAGALLSRTAIVAISTRVADHCRALGCTGPILVARQASDPALVEVIGEWGNAPVATTAQFDEEDSDR
jgi:uroporphyrinogen-III synthase